MKRFVLIDGNAIVHRAFHALPPLTNKKGELINAVFGFFSMFLKILSDLKPTHIAVCFDRAAPTFRQALFVGYQATRPKTADELISQIAMVHEILEKIGIAIFELDGYEADDVIGTLANQAKSEKRKAKNLEVIIVSGDRDLLQLVNSHVKVYAPIVGLTSTVTYDEKVVEEKYGVKPSQIVDYKALIGDPSDNYPGVKGIGPKTAAQLLKQYRTFENLYEHLKELLPKTAEQLATDAEQASLAKKLAMIACDAPITLDIEKCSMKLFDRERVASVFEDLGFESLAKRLKERVNNGSEKENKKPQKENTKQLGLL